MKQGRETVAFRVKELEGGRVSLTCSKAFAFSETFQLEGSIMYLPISRLDESAREAVQRYIREQEDEIQEARERIEFASCRIRRAAELVSN